MSLTDNKLVNYIKESRLELKKVTWPTRKEAIQHSLLVIGISLGTAIILGLADYFFAWGIEQVINR